MSDATYTIPDEHLPKVASQLEEGTLNKIRSGTPVSAQQAAAAIAHITLEKRRPKSRWTRAKLWFIRKVWRGY